MITNDDELQDHYLSLAREYEYTTQGGSLPRYRRPSQEGL